MTKTKNLNYKEKAFFIFEKQKEEPLFNKSFLAPIDIILKPNDKKKDGLHVGIQHASKTKISDNKFKLYDFQSIEEISKSEQSQIESLREQKCDNLISLMKKKHGIEIAICICMYNEDKLMLKRTLHGVYQNCRELVEKKGFKASEIGIFIISDGIYLAHPSMEDFVEEMEKDNCIYLSEKDEVELTDLEYFDNRELNEEDNYDNNINHVLFTPHEIEDRKARQFSQRKKEYTEFYEMIEFIEKLESQEMVCFEDLKNEILQNIFLEIVAESEKESEVNSNENEKNENFETKLKSIFSKNNTKGLAFVRKTLAIAKKNCLEYVTAREDLCLLNSFRVPLQVLQIEEKESNEINSLCEEIIGEKKLKINLFYACKYSNGGKLSSHNLFFNGFCQELKPKYCVLLDVGLAPEKDAIVKMIVSMQENPKIGGVCGYMMLRIEKLDEKEKETEKKNGSFTSFCQKFVDIQRAQQFEYHFAHLVDKSFESAFGFIHVLPGAFSAYRMDAIWGKDTSNSELSNSEQSNSEPPNSELLREYFESIDKDSRFKNFKYMETSVIETICKIILPNFLCCCFEKPHPDSFEKFLFDKNVSLAEDRTLCMGIKRNGFDLKFIPDSISWVDSMKTLQALLDQRRRWINGSNCAFDKVKSTIESENIGCCLHLQIIYLVFMNWLSFIAPALFMFTVHIAMFTFQANVLIPLFHNFGLLSNVDDPSSNKIIGLFVNTIDFLYLVSFIGLIIYSVNLRSDNEKFRSFYYRISSIYGVFAIIVFSVFVYDIVTGLVWGKSTFLVQNPEFENMIPLLLIDILRYIMIGLVGLYILPTLVFLSFCRFNHIVDILMSTFSFIFYTPTYLNILTTFAICKLDNTTWGTKGLNKEKQIPKEMEENWQRIKMVEVCKYLVFNIGFGFIFIILGNLYVPRFYLTFAIVVIIAFTFLIKVLIAFVYMIQYRIQYKSPPKREPAREYKENNRHNVSTQELTDLDSESVDPIDQYFNQMKKSVYSEITFQNGWVSPDAKRTPTSINRRIYKANRILEGQEKNKQNLKGETKYTEFRSNFT